MAFPEDIALYQLQRFTYEYQILDQALTRKGHCQFRLLQDGKRVKYITVENKVAFYDGFDLEVSINKLLETLPQDGRFWNYGFFFMVPDGPQLAHFRCIMHLPRIKSIWHPQLIDHRDLHFCESVRPNLYKATCDKFDDGKRVVMVKYARFPEDILRLEHETIVYNVIDGHKIGPEFLGHVVEDNRVIGFVLDCVEGATVPVTKNLPECRRPLMRMHDLRLLHRNTDRENFLVKEDGTAVLIDFSWTVKDENTMHLAEELICLEQRITDDVNDEPVIQHYSII